MALKISWDLVGVGGQAVKENCRINRAYLNKWRMILIFQIRLSTPPQNTCPVPIPPEVYLWGDMATVWGTLKNEEQHGPVYLV